MNFFLQVSQVSLRSICKNIRWSGFCSGLEWSLTGVWKLLEIRLKEIKFLHWHNSLQQSEILPLCFIRIFFSLFSSFIWSWTCSSFSMLYILQFGMLAFLRILFFFFLKVSSLLSHYHHCYLIFLMLMVVTWFSPLCCPFPKRALTTFLS